jgi:hypothetical protein
VIDKVVDSIGMLRRVRPTLQEEIDVYIKLPSEVLGRLESPQPVEVILDELDQSLLLL